MLRPSQTRGRALVVPELRWMTLETVETPFFLLLSFHTPCLRKGWIPFGVDDREERHAQTTINSRVFYPLLHTSKPRRLHCSSNSRSLSHRILRVRLSKKERGTRKVGILFLFFPFDRGKECLAMDNISRKREREGWVAGDLYSRSTTRAEAPPPPLQMAATPIFFPWWRRAWSKVTTIRAPLQPIGWPSATAPPLTFILLWSRLSNCCKKAGPLWMTSSWQEIREKEAWSYVHVCQIYNSKSFVDFPEINFIGRDSCMLERKRNGIGRRSGKLNRSPLRIRIPFF